MITCEVLFTREVFPRRKSGVQHNPPRSHSLGTFHRWDSFSISGNDGNLLKPKFSDVSRRSTLPAGLSKNCHFSPLMSPFLPSHPASIIENFSTKFPFTAPVPSRHQCRRASTPWSLSLLTSSTFSFTQTQHLLTVHPFLRWCHYYTTSKISTYSILPAFAILQLTFSSTSTLIILQTHRALQYIDPNLLFTIFHGHITLFYFYLI